MARTKRTHPVMKFLIVIFLFGVLIAIGFFANKIYNIYYPSSTNATTNTTIIIQNQTNIDQTIVEAEQSNIFDLLIFIGIGFMVTGLLGFLVYMLFKYFNTKKPFTSANKMACMKQAYKDLVAQGYKIGHEMAKQSYPIFGGGEEKNPGWSFIFVKRKEDFRLNIRHILPNNLVSCKVKARTKEVYSEREGYTLYDIEKELNDNWFGKRGVPNYPVKPERKPSIADLFSSSKSNVSLALDPNQIQEDEE